IRSITAEGRDILADGLTIAGPGTVPVEITVADDGGTVSGTVTGKDDKPSAGAIVVLVPEAKLRRRRDLYQGAATDQYGRFEVAGIAPGEYRAFAWEDVEPGIWHDADFLKTVESKGERITVRASERGSVQLKVVSDGH